HGRGMQRAGPREGDAYRLLAGQVSVGMKHLLRGDRWMLVGPVDELPPPRALERRHETQPVEVRHLEQIGDAAGWGGLLGRGLFAHHGLSERLAIDEVPERQPGDV